jgi:predicted HTH domain antitoxin
MNMPMRFSFQKAAEMYKSGKITFSKAAADADLTLWEMEQYLVRRGFKSQYSVDDLTHELDLLSKTKKMKH